MKKLKKMEKSLEWNSMVKKTPRFEKKTMKLLLISFVSQALIYSFWHDISLIATIKTIVYSRYREIL